jgi:hypothetical protein
LIFVILGSVFTAASVVPTVGKKHKPHNKNNVALAVFKSLDVVEPSSHAALKFEQIEPFNHVFGDFSVQSGSVQVCLLSSTKYKDFQQTGAMNCDAVWPNEQVKVVDGTRIRMNYTYTTLQNQPAYILVLNPSSRSPAEYGMAVYAENAGTTPPPPPRPTPAFHIPPIAILSGSVALAFVIGFSVGALLSCLIARRRCKKTQQSFLSSAPYIVQQQPYIAQQQPYTIRQQPYSFQPITVPINSTHSINDDLHRPVVHSSIYPQTVNYQSETQPLLNTGQM